MITTNYYGLKKPEGTDPVNIQDLNGNADIIDSELAKKAGKSTATQSVDGLMSSVDKKKLDGVAQNANAYTHPASHPSSMITQDATHRFTTDALVSAWNSAVTHISDAVKHITAAERNLWNTVSNKVDKINGKGLSTNDYTTGEKNKLAGIATGANNYVHPTNSGNQHIPSGGGSGQILRWNGNGAAAWGEDTNTWRGIQNNLSSNSAVDSLAAAQGSALNNKISSLNADLANHNHDGRYYTEAEVNTLLAKKQTTLLNNTYVSTNTTNASGVITLGIDISILGLTARPKCAFLQGQNSGIYSLERYIYSYDNSTATRIVFVVNYGVPNTQITDRYGYVVFP